MCSEDLDVCFVEVDIRCYESVVRIEGVWIYDVVKRICVFLERGYVISG